MLFSALISTVFIDEIIYLYAGVARQDTQAAVNVAEVECLVGV